MNIRLLDLVGVLAVAVSGARAAAPPPVHYEPFKAVVHGKLVLTCGYQQRRAWRPLVEARATPLGQDRPIHEVGCLYSYWGVPIRWQVGHGAFWVASSPTGLPGAGRGHPSAYGAAHLNCLELTELLKGEAYSFHGAKLADTRVAFAWDTPASRAS